MKLFIFSLVAFELCWGQSDECKPSFLNIPGAPYPCVHPDRRVTFRVAAPDAQKVQVRMSGAHDMTKGADGLWIATIPPQVIGFHYYSVDGDAAYYSVKDVPCSTAGAKTSRAGIRRETRTSS